MALKESAIKHLIIDFASYFNNNNIAYVLIGGLAVNIWGRIRTTTDADFIIDQQRLDIEDFIQYLNKKGYKISSSEVKTAFSDKTSVTIWSGLFRIDFKGIYDKFATQTVESALAVQLFDIEVHIGSPELLIISKLCYGSEQDFEDAASIYLRLRNKKNLDTNKISVFAKKLDILDRLSLLEALIGDEIKQSDLEKKIDTLKPFDYLKFNNF